MNFLDNLMTDGIDNEEALREFFGRSAPKQALKKYKNKNSNKIAIGSDEINVYIYCMGTMYCTQIHLDCGVSKLYKFINMKEDVDGGLIKEYNITLCFNNKPLQNGLTLRDYNLYEGCSLTCIIPLLGGSSEKEIRRTQHKSKIYLKKKYESKIAQSNLKIQSIPLLDLKYFREMLKALPFDKMNKEYILKLGEDLGILLVHLYKTNSISDLILACINFIKLRINESLILSVAQSSVLKYINETFKSRLQAGEDSIFTNIKDLLNNFSQIQETNTYKKLYKILMYVISVTLFSKYTTHTDLPFFGKIEKRFFMDGIHKGQDFFVVIIQSLLFLFERGYDCVKTGSFQPLFHSPSSYKLWYSEACDIKLKSAFLCNPEPHGFDKFSFHDKLNKLIEQGESILKFGLSDVVGKRIVGSTLNDLKMIKATELTKSAARKDRKAPFSCLIFGGSSIAKSAFTNLLFYHYGKVHNLPIESEFKYTRNANDEYWSGFDSTQWCVQLDDIAYLHPNKCSDGDPSIKEMLQVVNNVPFVPAQADLQDKGKTPMQCKLVLATTNSKDLNANIFFSCPLAVRRRLPWVITLIPKDEYLKDDKMIDPQKIPELKAGEYPDLWNITVERIIPDKETPDRAQLAPVGSNIELCHESGDKSYCTFTCIYDFIAWFSKESIKFEQTQKKVNMSDEIIRETEICAHCYRPTDKHSEDCSIYKINIVQTGNSSLPFHPTLNCDMERMMSGIDLPQYDGNSYMLRILFVFYMCCYAIAMTLKMYAQGLTETCMMYLFVTVKSCASRYIMDNLTAYYMKNFAWIYSNNISSKMIINTIAILTALLYSYKLSKRFASLVTPIGDVDKKQYSAHDLVSASNMSYNYAKEEMNENLNLETEPTEGKVPKPMAEERVNVWYKDDYQTTDFDISPMSSSYAHKTKDDILKFVSKNCVHFVSRYDGLKIPVSATCIGGHFYLTNNHGIPTKSTFELTIINDINQDGVNPNISVLITPSMYVRCEEKDLCLLYIPNIPPKKNIKQLFSKQSLSGNHKGFYVGRHGDGRIFTHDVANINKQYMLIQELNTSTFIWTGKSSTPTQHGDCGALLFSNFASTIILGIHVVGDNCQTGALSVSQYDLDALMSQFDDLPIIQSEPMLCTKDKIRTVGDLAPKSTLRYIEKGTINAYGSFQDFRPKHKSKVVKTLICDSMLERGYTIKTGKPVMSGYGPWRNAMLDMVNPVTSINMDVLKICVAQFTHDILSRLTTEDLSMVEVYTLDVAINGCDGVAYVDKMNRNTSMGNPWKETKKNHIIYDNDSDRVTFDDETLERVKICERKYLAKERFMPNFCAHLKDEATTFAKIAAEKTRVFTGAPVDWSIVVRKYLLSIIRLIQNNRFIFESGPGTIAQSAEWHEIRNYLTQFGEDNMIAGDYSKFDKRMPSTIILSAFQIIYNICKKAGYSQDELNVVWGIAEDTAFPLVDFNGDLVQFFGTNPSGHPLTVIINGLANALYMRYCYILLNPNKEVSSFKDNVSLMTYGDDNCMGVSKSCPWFNHTTISDLLATVDIKYTMAEKEAESVPYIHMDSISFLKRTWRFEKELNKYVCPLEHDSIEKMLTMCVKSKTITPEAQAIAVIATAIREYFWYGREIFEDKRTMFMEIIDINDLSAYYESYVLPTWDELILSYQEASKQVKPWGVQNNVPLIQTKIFSCNAVTGQDLDNIQGSVGITRKLHMGVPQSSFLGKACIGPLYQKFSRDSIIP